VLRVTNGGNVLSQTELRAIFAPTVRGGKAQASDASLGLGLTIVREIAHAHDGEIHATSSAEEGTTFRVVLPKD
jgi:phosphoserine phosphatase RsbU/P